MTRRSLSLLALSLAALTLSACADSAAPTAPASPRQIQAAGQAGHDVLPDTCRNGWTTSTGRAC